jgi:hypothetical protein
LLPLYASDLLFEDSIFALVHSFVVLELIENFIEPNLSRILSAFGIKKFDHLTLLIPFPVLRELD